MHVRCSRQDLLAQLNPMRSVADQRSIPVLSHLLLEAAGDRLNLAATDLEISMTSWSQAEVEAEGSIAVQARKLAEIVKACSGDEITLAVKREGELSVSAGRSRFKLHGLPAEDFPTLPAIGDETLPVRLPFATFKAMIGKVFYAISTEESRFQLSGALLKLGENELALVSTDGHRLALVEREVPGVAKADGVIVPRKALLELQRWDDGDDLEFRRGPHHLSFTAGRRQLICRVLEGTFPDYDRVISRDNDKKIVVGREDLAAAVSRVALFTGDRTRGIRMEMADGELTFSAVNPDLGEAVEELACTTEGGEVAMGLNPDYLGHFLASTPAEQVCLELRDENSQLLASPIDGPDKRYLCVIMPIRV